MDQTPAHLIALLRHVEDLRDGTHAGLQAREAKEDAFTTALEWLAPVVARVLREVDVAVLRGTGEIADTDVQREGDGTLARTWTLGWAEQATRGMPPVTIRAWFGGSFHHPHLRGATEHDWPLNIYEEGDAENCCRSCAAWSRPTCTTWCCEPIGGSPRQR